MTDRWLPNQTFEAPRCRVRTVWSHSSCSRPSHGRLPKHLVTSRSANRSNALSIVRLRAAAAADLDVAERRRRAARLDATRSCVSPSAGLPSCTQRMYGKSSMWPRGQTMTKREGTSVRLQSPQTFDSKVVSLRWSSRRLHFGHEYQRGNRTTGMSPPSRRGRHDEAGDHQLALQARLVQVRVADAPPVDAGDHEGLVSERDDRSDAVRGDELASANGSLYGRQIMSLARKRFDS